MDSSASGKVRGASDYITPQTKAFGLLTVFFKGGSSANDYILPIPSFTRTGNFHLKNGVRDGCFEATSPTEKDIQLQKNTSLKFGVLGGWYMDVSKNSDGPPKYGW